MRALGMDTSVWNDDNSTPQPVDFVKAKDNGISFVFIKASQFSRDEDFVLNWENAKKAGLLRGAYHFLDWRKDARAQARLFASIIKDDPGELPPIVDFEMRSYAPPQSVARGFLWAFISEFRNWFPNITPMIYTGYYFWKEFGSPELAWAKYPLWLAWYASEAWIRICAKGGDGSPPPWKKWTFWQYTDSGDGRKYGCESSKVDLNWFNGTEEELKLWADQKYVPPLPSAVPTYTVVPAAINVREGSTQTSRIIGTLTAGTVVTVTGVPVNGYIKLADRPGWVWYLFLKRV